MKVGDLVEVITRPIGHMYLRKYIGTKHKIISIVEGKIYLDKLDEEDLRRYEKLYYWESELKLSKDNEPQVLKDKNKNKEQFQMKYSPVRSTIINGLLEIDLQNASITISGKDILEILQEYENDCVKLTIEKI